MNAVEFDSYLWKESTCSFFTDFSICNDDIFLVLSKMKSSISNMTTKCLAFVHQHLLERIPVWESGRFSLQRKSLNVRRAFERKRL